MSQTTNRAIPVMFYVVSEKLEWAMKGNGAIKPSRGKLYGTFATAESAAQFVGTFPFLQQANMRIVEQ